MFYVLEPIVSRVAEKCGISRECAFGWLRRPSVKKKISALKASNVQKTSITLSEVLNMALRIADFDLKDVVKSFKHEPETNYYTITYEDWDKIDGKVVKDVRPVVKDGIQLLNIKLYDKTPYIKMLLDHFKDTKPDQHLHVHMSREEIAAADAQTVSEDYQRMLGA